MSLTPPLVIEVHVPIREIERWCVCLLGISMFVPDSTIFRYCVVFFRFLAVKEQFYRYYAIANHLFSLHVTVTNEGCRLAVGKAVDCGTHASIPSF